MAHLLGEPYVLISVRYIIVTDLIRGLNEDNKNYEHGPLHGHHLIFILYIAREFTTD